MKSIHIIILLLLSVLEVLLLWIMGNIHFEQDGNGDISLRLHANEEFASENDSLKKLWSEWRSWKTPFACLNVRSGQW